MVHVLVWHRFWSLHVVVCVGQLGNVPRCMHDIYVDALLCLLKLLFWWRVHEVLIVVRFWDHYRSWQQLDQVRMYGWSAQWRPLLLSTSHRPSWCHPAARGRQTVAGPFRLLYIGLLIRILDLSLLPCLQEVLAVHMYDHVDVTTQPSNAKSKATSGFHSLKPCKSLKRTFARLRRKTL